MSYASASTDAPVRAFTVRKEPKTHGTGRLIEGRFKPATGGRDRRHDHHRRLGAKARRAVRAGGGSVVGVLALVDREEGGREALEAEGTRVISLARASEIVPLIRLSDRRTAAAIQ